MEHVAIVIPSIPSRSELLARAISSIEKQKIPSWIKISTFVHVDKEQSGAWNSRNAAIDLAINENPDWVLFLDDDDELYPNAVHLLVTLANQFDVDIAWGWFDVIGGTDPFPDSRGRQFNIEDPHIVPIVYLVKASILFKCHIEMNGAFKPNNDIILGEWQQQDLPIFKQMITAGAKSKAISEKVWIWHHHGQNTSGMPHK